jgi:hypothetical protein
MALDGEPLADAPLGRRERAVGIAGARQQTLDHVAARGRMEHRHARIARPTRVGDDRQRSLVDLDQLERVLGEIAARRDDERDRLADVAHQVAWRAAAAGTRRPMPAAGRAVTGCADRRRDRSR